MLEAFAWAVAPAVLGGAVLSVFIERFLQPAAQPVWRRPLPALAIHLGVWLLLLSCLLAVLQRPYFAAGALSAGMLFVVLVSNAKFHSLREPFVFQDFEYFADALQHPRLYMPFLGLGRAVLAVLALTVAVWGGLALEDSLLVRLPVADFRIGLALLALSSLVLLYLGARSKLAVSFDAVDDLQRLGLLASMWRYGEAEVAPIALPSPFKRLLSSVATTTPVGNLLVVQSESFFDARRLSPAIRSEVLREFDALRASALINGQLAVAAWGANTVRTEFAFLSGLANASLGVHRYNPYRRLARQGIVSLAHVLKRHGYRTVCVHPYVAGFYDRDKVFPRLGFDEFIDLRSFTAASTNGPYIGDVALAEKVCSLLQGDDGPPLFLFVITMENHGPLHLEKVLPGDVARYYASPPPPGCDDLTIYLRHLSNADRMAGILRAGLSASPRPGCLCWFGDHVPIMPDVYRALAIPDGRTDYLIWRSDRQVREAATRDMPVEELAELLMREIGLIAD